MDKALDWKSSKDVPLIRAHEDLRVAQLRHENNPTKKTERKLRRKEKQVKELEAKRHA